MTLHRPQSEEVISETTILYYDQPPVEPPPRTLSRKSYENVYEMTTATNEIDTITRAKSSEFDSAWMAKTITSERQRRSANEEVKQPASPTREPLFKRNASERQVSFLLVPRIEFSLIIQVR